MLWSEDFQSGESTPVVEQDHGDVLKELENLEISRPPPAVTSQIEEGEKVLPTRATRRRRKEKSPSKDIPVGEERSFVEVRSTPGKGVGLFASRKIPAGTCLLVERPLISLEKHEENDAEAVEREFAKLAKSQQKQHLKLFDAEKSRMTKVVSIYYSNCYNTDGYKEDGEGGSCIGALASRINHSCIPNAQFSYDNQSGLMLFHAIKPIVKGKEIFTNYDKSVFELSQRRKQKQRLHYGFICCCEACSPQTEFWEKSDQRRRAMVEAKKEIRECENEYEQAGATQQDPLVLLLRLEGLLVKEGLLSTVLANTYRSMAKWATRKGNFKDALKWKRKELEICITCFGDGFKRVRDLSCQTQQDQVLHKDAN